MTALTWASAAAAAPLLPMDGGRSRAALWDAAAAAVILKPALTRRLQLPPSLPEALGARREALSSPIPFPAGRAPSGVVGRGLEAAGCRFPWQQVVNPELSPSPPRASSRLLLLGCDAARLRLSAGTSRALAALRLFLLPRVLTGSKLGWRRAGATRWCCPTAGLRPASPRSHGAGQPRAAALQQLQLHPGGVLCS